MEGRGEAAEGAAFDGLLAGVRPIETGADAAGFRIVTSPIELGRPGGRLAVFVVEIEEGPILAAASCDFLKPMTYPCDALVTQSVTRIGRSSMDLDVTIEGDEATPILYAKGKNVLVWMDYASGKSAPWPETLRAALGDP